MSVHVGLMSYGMSKENSETSSVDMVAVYPAADEAVGLALSTLMIKFGKSSSVARGRRAESSGTGEAKVETKTASAVRPNLKCIRVMLDTTCGGYFIPCRLDGPAS